VPLVEWLRVNETIREKVRRRESSSLVAMHSLETSARALVEQGVTSEAEYQRLFGL